MQLSRISFLTLILVFTSSTASADNRTGEQIYNASCATCHATGVANAPKTNDSAAWKARAKSIDELLASSKKGLNAMPPMGLCVDCSDSELKAAINFMLLEKK